MTKKLKIFLIIFISTVFKIGGVFFVWTINNNKEEIIEQPISEEIKIKEVEPILEELILNARAAISVLVTPEGSSQILFKKNINEELPIASLTKLMTAYVVLKYYDLSHKIEISEQAILQPGEAGNLKVGQTLPVKDLLFPLLIPSSNDAAFALAENICKEQFIFLMNLEAEQLGLKNTYFVNPSGLDEINVSNYSTISDLIKFTKHLLTFDKDNRDELGGEDKSSPSHTNFAKQNEVLRRERSSLRRDFADARLSEEDKSSPSRDFADARLSEEDKSSPSRDFADARLFWDILSTRKINLYGQTLVSTNQLLNKIPGIVGGRTGWTPKAGGALILVLKTSETQANEVSEAWKGSTKCSSPGYLINIILGTPSPEARFEEMKRLIDWTKSQKTINSKQ